MTEPVRGFKQIDNAGRQTLTVFDHMGRQAATVEHFIGEDPSLTEAVGTFLDGLAKTADRNRMHPADSVGWPIAADATIFRNVKRNQSTIEYQDTRLYADAHDDWLMTTTIYPDGDDVDDNVQVDYDSLGHFLPACVTNAVAVVFAARLASRSSTIVTWSQQRCRWQGAQHRSMLQ